MRDPRKDFENSKKREKSLKKFQEKLIFLKKQRQKLSVIKQNKTKTDNFFLIFRLNFPLFCDFFWKNYQREKHFKHKKKSKKDEKYIQWNFPDDGKFSCREKFSVQNLSTNENKKKGNKNSEGERERDRNK